MLDVEGNNAVHNKVAPPPYEPHQHQEHDIGKEENRIDLAGAARNLNLRQQANLRASGFRLKVMVVGESGLGKSTCIRTLFKLNDNQVFGGQEYISRSTVKIEEHETYINEGNMGLHLTVVDTPGYGDYLKASKHWKPILEYIDRQMNDYLNKEMDAHRPPGPIESKRVDAVLYFIAAHRLKPVDLHFLSQLNNKVSILPIIAKADTMTTNELRVFKEMVRVSLKAHNINYFQPVSHEAEMRKAPPFAVIGSLEAVSIPGIQHRITGRQYAWGTCEVENPDHCDVALLRKVLISSHMADLHEKTEEIYSAFRTNTMLKREKEKKAQVARLCHRTVWLLLFIGVCISLYFIPLETLIVLSVILLGVFLVMVLLWSSLACRKQTRKNKTLCVHYIYRVLAAGGNWKSEEEEEHEAAQEEERRRHDVRPVVEDFDDFLHGS